MNLIKKIVWHGRPITKKNHQRIVGRGKRKWVVPSKEFINYQNICLYQVKKKDKLQLSTPINLKCLYYMPTNHRVDLVNLLEATCDILVEAHVIGDDNSKIIKSHDGSRVLYDKDSPRVEIYLEEFIDE
ncbi:MAG: RusA family crossover junction endodeoxyribonuclease [Peptoniphilaceae bacterium]|nr:RusA family crossover junction endodeoxyribonuclease [Peptoniphilaceae bacterium]MDY6019284.1 RusA family crossover junction endodeoxyribonuclease [Anaerococcus sp.]